VHLLAILLRVNGNGADAHLSACSEHTNCNFTYDVQQADTVRNCCYSYNNLTNEANVDSRLHHRCTAHNVYFLIVTVEQSMVGIDAVSFGRYALAALEYK